MNTGKPKHFTLLSLCQLTFPFSFPPVFTTVMLLLSDMNIISWKMFHLCIVSVVLNWWDFDRF